MEWILLGATIVATVIAGAAVVGARAAGGDVAPRHQARSQGETQCEPFARRIAGGWEYIDENGEAWRSDEEALVFNHEDGDCCRHDWVPWQAVRDAKDRGE